MLKRFTAFLLSLLLFAGSLVPQNDVEELGRLPELVRHYRYHALPAHGGLTLREFLAQHYGAGAASATNSWYLGQILKAQHLPAGHDRLPLQGQHDIAPLVYVVPTTPLVPPVLSLPPAAPRHATPARPRYADADGPDLLEPPRA